LSRSQPVSDAKIGDPFLEQRALHQGQRAHIFFRRQAAHIAEGEGAVLPVAKRGAEYVSIHGVGHEEAGLSGLPAQHLHQFRIGREEQFGNAIKARGGEKTPALGGAGSFSAPARGQHGERPGGAQTGVLMQVRLPEGGQRNFQAIGEHRAQDADIAGTGDLDQIGLKLSQQGRGPSIVAQKQQIELVRLIERKFDGAAPQTQAKPRGRGVGGVASFGVNHQERQVMLGGEGLEAAPDRCNAIHLVICVWEECNPRLGLAQEMASEGLSDNA
jgi:hypothetical protein